MQILPLKLAGTYEITLQPRHDERGYFMRVFDEKIFHEHNLGRVWTQENQAFSKAKGIIRGLHFQRPPHAETKLVRVVCGRILDVFVDLRKHSPTYGQWDSVELSADNHKLVYLPKGFAHGYCTLTEESVVLYKVDESYAPHFEGGIRWDDATLGISWPAGEHHVSAKDSTLTLFREFVTPF
jgi:dTDP-4-dehydrorhamnose 3,5-epimerase